MLNGKQSITYNLAIIRATQIHLAEDDTWDPHGILFVPLSPWKTRPSSEAGKGKGRPPTGRATVHRWGGEDRNPTVKLPHATNGGWKEPKGHRLRQERAHGPPGAPTAPGRGFVLGSTRRAVEGCRQGSGTLDGRRCRGRRPMLAGKKARRQRRRAVCERVGERKIWVASGWPNRNR
jgi:hypothetical protein